MGIFYFLIYTSKLESDPNRYIFTNFLAVHFISSSYGETEKNKHTFKTPEQFTRNYEIYGPLKIPMDQLLRFSNNYHEDKKKKFVQHDDNITQGLKEMSVEDDDDAISTPTTLSSASNTLSPLDSRYNSMDYSDSDDTSSILSDKDYDTNTFSETSRTDRSDSTCSSASVKRLIARRERRRSS